MSLGISHRAIRETPIAVIDFETTGLTAGADRVVEVAIARVDPQGQPYLVLDTLVNPQRRVSATEIHGITDADVANAPRFADIAGDVVASLHDCTVAAYNVYFDIKFLSAELFTAGIDHEPPHFCLMYLRPMLGLGSRCKLDAACQSHGIPYRATHMAAYDALAAAQLLAVCLQEADRRGIRTFGELGQLKSYKFISSFAQDPLPHPSKYQLTTTNRIHSRSGCKPSRTLETDGRSSGEVSREKDAPPTTSSAHAVQPPPPTDRDKWPPLPPPPPIPPERLAIASYWDALKTVIADLDVTDEEAAHVTSERKRLGLSAEQARALHARVYASVIQEFTSDQRLDDTETRRLRRLHQCLSKLGWAPGE